jgi:hypothetical protein
LIGSAADSRSSPVAAPLASRTISPPSGFAVASVIPAWRSAAAFTKVA